MRHQPVATEASLDDLARVQPPANCSLAFPTMLGDLLQGVEPVETGEVLVRHGPFAYANGLSLDWLHLGVDALQSLTAGFVEPLDGLIDVRCRVVLRLVLWD